MYSPDIALIKSISRDFCMKVWDPENGHMNNETGQAFKSAWKYDKERHTNVEQVVTMKVADMKLLINMETYR